MASASATGEQLEWSKRETLDKAASRAPVLVRVEERHRGNSDETSLNPGDIMALHSCTVVKGRSVVLVYCKGKCDVTQGAGCTEDMYRALLIIPLDIVDLAQIEVSIVEDPDGQCYQNWVKCNFPKCSWANREASAQTALANCYSPKEIVVLQAVRPAKSPPQTLPKPQPIPTPLPVPGSQPLPSPTGFSSGKEAQGPAGQPVPPPRHTRGLNRSISFPEPLSQLTSLPPPLPPRQPRHHSICGGQQIKTFSEGGEFEAVYEIGSDSEGEGSHQSTPVFFLTFAEMAAASSPPVKESQLKSQASRFPDKKKVKELGKELGGTLKAAGNRILSKIASTKLFERSQEQPTVMLQTFRSRVPRSSVTKSPVAGSPLPESSTPRQPPASRPGKVDDGDIDRTGEYLALYDIQADDHLYTDIETQATLDDHLYTDIGTQARVTAQCHETWSSPAPLKPVAEEGKKVTMPESSANEQRPRRYTKKPTMRVRPVHSVTPSTAPHPMMAPGGGVQTGPVASHIEKMTVPELAARLELCGMTKLAQICQDNFVDGRFFAVLTKEQMKAEPFVLSDWDITRVFQVKTGWIPHK